MTLEEQQKLDILEKQNHKLISTLINIVNSAVHPDRAVRVINLDLKPIRETLRDCGIIDQKLGIIK